MRALLPKNPIAMLSREKILLGCILILAFILRLYRINNPVGDWHAFRQADTASVTREYVKAPSIDLLRPQYHDLGNIQSGLDNLDGYRMVEFPLVNAVLAWILRNVPSLDLVITSRLAAVLASLGTLYALYRLLVLISGRPVALLAAFWFAVLPYSIYYSRVILPEPFFIFFSVVSLWQFAVFSRSRTFWSFLWSTLALALAALLKPFVVFLAPVYLGLLYFFRQHKAYLDYRTYLLPLFAFTPLLAWRNWINQFPTGVPAADWLFNGNEIRFKPAWFRWLFYERLTKLFLGYAGLLLLIGNFKKNNDLPVYLAWAVGILAYLSVFATGNVQHDYYQNMLLPAVAAALGRGSYYFYQWLRQHLKLPLALAIIGLVSLTTWLLAWQQVAGYFNVNHWEYVKAGAAVDRLVPADAKVIAPAMGDTQFLFQTNRRGWPIGFEIDQKIAKGASIYVSTSYDWEAKALEEKYQVIEHTPDYIIIDLKQAKL